MLTLGIASKGSGPSSSCLVSASVCRACSLLDLLLEVAVDASLPPPATLQVHRSAVGDPSMSPRGLPRQLHQSATSRRALWFRRRRPGRSFMSASALSSHSQVPNLEHVIKLRRQLEQSEESRERRSCRHFAVFRAASILPLQTGVDELARREQHRVSTDGSWLLQLELFQGSCEPLGCNVSYIHPRYSRSGASSGMVEVTVTLGELGWWQRDNISS